MINQKNLLLSKSISATFTSTLLMHCIRTMLFFDPHYLLVFDYTKQHGHVCEHPDNDEGNMGNTLRVQHVWIVSAHGVAKDVARQRTSATAKGKSILGYELR